MLALNKCPGCGQNYGEPGLSQIQELQCGLQTGNEGNSTMQEELASLFSKNLNFHLQEPGPRSHRKEDYATVATSTIGYSSSQHYYPAPAHLASKHAENACADLGLDVEQVLRVNGVDPTHLVSSQIQLFTKALPEQQTRLLELWRISHAEKKKMEGIGSWKETTIEQEEEWARIRLERSNAQYQSVQSSEDTLLIPEDADMDSALGDVDHPQSVEPYMKSGYEILAERDYNEQRAPSIKTYQHALDPVFSSKEWWKQPMEYQYGMFDQLNHFRPAETRLHQEDEEML